MLAEAVSGVARAANAAVNAAQEAANAANARIQDFAGDLARSAAHNHRAPPQPANNNDSQSASLPAGAPPPPRPGESNGSDPSASPTGVLPETAGAVNTLVNPADEIGKLNSDGDQVVMSMTGEGKLQVPLVRVPIGVGAKGQYGFDITVQQVGDTPQPGTNGRAPTYDVTFDKNLLAGATVEPEVSGFDPAVELNLRTSGSVTMNFASQADATRAVGILQRLAASEAVRDAGRAVTPGLSNPVSNPVVDDSSGLSSLPTPADPLADRIAPSAEDMAFLRDNVTSYTSRAGLHERGKVAVKFANLGIEPRLDANQQISRTVDMPRDGQPGRLTYTLSGDLQASTKEKLTIGKQHIDQLEIGYVPQNIVDHGQLRGEVSISWDLPAGATDSTVSGQPVPELSGLSGGEPLGAPDRVSARLQLDHQIQPLTDLSRTDMRRISIEATTRNPGEHAGPVVNDLLDGDLEGAFRGMGDDFTVTAQNETVLRNGVNQQHEVGVEMKDVFEAKVSLIGNVGRDDVTGRRTATFTGTEIADRLGGPQQPSPSEPPGVPPQPPAEHRPDQLVVVPSDGVNVRAEPSLDGRELSVFQHGTFVQPTGQRQTDGQGNQWVEVQGPDVNDSPVQGWVAAQHVQSHPAGAMDETGRINPDLERQGYREHVVQPDDTVWDIARRDGANFREMLQLNGDHLINPGLVFPGDKIYIPGSGHAQPPATPPAQPPQAPPAAEQPSAPSGAPSSGAPSSDAPSGAPSDDPTTSGAPSGAPSGGVPTGEAPAPGQQPPPNAPVNGRADLDRVLRSYQIGDDPGGLVQWEPHGGILGRLAGLVTDPRTVTATEAQMLDRMSVWDVKALHDIEGKASGTANSQFPPPQDKRADFAPGTEGDKRFRNWALNDGHNDAFRHAYANGLMTQRFGADFTERFTRAHEGVPGNKADREAMDLYNNEVGRRIAVENPNASEEQLAGLVRQAIDRGELLVIDRAGNLAWSDQVRYGEHGIANDGPAPGALPRPQPGGAPDGSGPGVS